LGTDIRKINAVKLGLAPTTQLPAINRYAPESSWVTFRWGPKFGEPYPNTQFPIEAADKYFPQTVSTYRDQQETLNSAAAFAALIDKVPEPVILLVIRPARLSHRRGAARAGEGHSGDRDLGHGLRCNPAGRSAEACGYTNPYRDRRPCPGSRRRLAQVSKRDGVGWGPRDVLPEAGIYGSGHTMMLDKE
jgi:hypothetical protein